MIRLVFVLSTIPVLCGCRAFRTELTDHEHFGTGELKAVKQAQVISNGGMQVSTTREYFKSGRLRSQSWSHDGELLGLLQFHENGRLKSEQRFNGGQVAYTAVYDDHGEVVSETGTKMKPKPRCIKCVGPNQAS